MFQSFNLIPTLNAAENITLPMDIAGARPDRQWLDQVIDTLGLRERLTHRPAQLSGGATGATGRPLRPVSRSRPAWRALPPTPQGRGAQAPNP